MNDFFKLPVALTEALSKNDMMLVVGGDRAVKITVVNEGHGCNVAGALNRGTGCGFSSVFILKQMRSFRCIHI